MEEFYQDNFEVDKDYKKTRWFRGDMSGSSASSDSHGVYSAYSAGQSTNIVSDPKNIL